ncbi:RE1 [Symbiodinium natans]|uniref:RE1 protein n=1 Tax=Symbiodinium natans TaxID=878477 RepID=A0A812V1X6_9DINO|nr:RE1 [Symbiodinium natans]CAE7597224.1 RE1 [Symbiodinium natans]
MASGVPATSFYASTSRGGEPAPGDVSPQDQGDGGDATRPHDGDRVPHDDVHRETRESKSEWADWGSWQDDGWTTGPWNRSWDGGDGWWSRSGWARDSNRRDGYDAKKKGKTWESTSTGSVGSGDGVGHDRESKESFSDPWGRRDSCSDAHYSRDDGRDPPDGWGPSTEGRGGPFDGARRGAPDASRGPSERMIVPTFAGNTDGGTEDIGTSARSYLRQIAAWRRMTRMSKDQQGLTLYQHLTDRAWVDAERLDVNRLGSSEGVDYLISWVQDRYLDVQITQVGRSLSEFFRKLRRKPTQSVRDYMAEFDRAFARLAEAGCQLPDMAAAWVFVDRMGLEEQAELNLLASVGNKYVLKDLQQAAIVHDRGMRKPWETTTKNTKKEWPNRKPFSANVADFEEPFSHEDHDVDHEEDLDTVPEEVASELYQAYLTHESAKQRYRETAKLRGSDAESLKRLAAEKLQAAKARSFCSACKRRGHWHLDSVCPLNRNNQGNTTTSTTATSGTSGGAGGHATRDSTKANFPCHVVHVTWDIGDRVGKGLVGITDTACARSVAGCGWMDGYLAEVRQRGGEPQFLSCKEAFKFGASKIFMANYGVLVGFKLGSHQVVLKVAVVNGDVPLLISRGAMAKMGMIIDVGENRATFKALEVHDMQLSVTDTGHPAFPIEPVPVQPHLANSSRWEDNELQILSPSMRYMPNASYGGVGGCGFPGDQGVLGEVEVDLEPCSTSWVVVSEEVAVSSRSASSPTSTPPISDRDYEPLFFPKKVGAAIKNMLLDESFSPETFASWWSSSNISNDFWIEDADYLIRVHVIPRRSFFNPLHWATQNLRHKELLLKSLGAVRSIHGIACKSHRAFPTVHGTWDRMQDNSAFPMLWVGRSVFTRKPMLNRPKNLSEFTKAELLAEAAARTLQVHERWTPAEIKSAIQEDRARGTDENIHGMQNLTLEQLKNRAMEAGYLLPAYPTRGAIMRILRGQNGQGPQSLLNFGRFKGNMYKDTPLSYRAWALLEVESSDNPSEDLVMFANWWKAEQHRWNDGRLEGENPIPDPEENATIPYVEDTSSSGSWAVLATRSSYPGSVPKPKGALSGPPVKTPPRRRGPGSVASSTPSRMDQDIPTEIQDPRWNVSGEEKHPDEVDDEEFHECLEGNDVRSQDEDEGDQEAENHDDFLDDYVILEGIEDISCGGEGAGRPGKPSMADESEAFTTEKVAKVTIKEQCERCDRLAKQKLMNKAFDYDDLLEVAKEIPLRYPQSKKPTNRGGNEVYGVYLGGMYTYGKFTGISRDSRRLPWTTRYVNSFMRSKTKGEWTSFVLFKNAATQIHSDVHNLPNSLVTTVTFGPFSGGELWIEGKSHEEGRNGCVVREDAQGNLHEGHLVRTRMKPVSFDGKTKHATQPWSGERWTLSCFATRGYSRGDVGLRDQLRDLRFPLRGLPVPQRSEPEDGPSFSMTTRPKKSTRKALWKSATRLAALTSWCTLAAVNWSQSIFPISRGSFGVSLYEIGGYSKSIEVAEMGFLTAEPFIAEENDETQVKVIEETLEEFSPAVLWIHGREISHLFSKFADSVHRYIDLGRKVVFEADPDDPFWTHNDMIELYDKYDGLYDVHVDEPDLLRFNHTNWAFLEPDHEDIKELVVYLSETYTVENQLEPPDGAKEDVQGASAITFEDEGETKIPPEVKSSLRRLHQNMGHPSNLDLARHLRLAGADPSVIEACKKINCQVCSRNKRGKSAKPASFPNLLDFNQVVAVDAFTVYDCQGEKLELMMSIDLGTGFALASPLQGHSGIAMESTFCSMWSNMFGAPGTMVLDLESGLQKGLARFSEWHGTFIRPIAGQAHWQQGSVERCIRTWKEIWSRVVDDQSASVGEAGMVLTAVNSAMNTLRRETGFSPSQAVWGRDPDLPELLKNSPQDEHVEHVISRDRQRAREHSLRIAAKEAYFKSQNDSKFRRALLQRSRVTGPELQVGAHVFFYRKPKNNKNWEWHGPAVVIGREGPNFWLSFSGRCHLVAPEHLRMASAEELGAAFALRTTQDDLQRLLDQDFADEEMYAGDDVEAEALLPQGDEEPSSSGRPEEGGRRRQSEEHVPPVAKRHRVKGPQRSDPSPYDTYMLKLPKTPRAKEKALEKELPWSMIPGDQIQGFKDAEIKQWEEHVEHNALTPLSLEESRDISKNKGDRVLNSRFAYRDKLWSRRREQPDVGWKHKARLVISGHKDPDLMKGLPTHAPTISRLGIHLLLQILASNLHCGWTGHAGDVTAAFLCGEELKRELYLRQPRTGLGNLHPEQILRIRKPIFGLVDSPASWWTKLRRTLQSLVLKKDGKTWKIVQCSLDHCIFMVQEVKAVDSFGVEVLDKPCGYLGVHVDDVLLIGQDEVCNIVKEQLSTVFPIKEWESGKFDYVGSFIEILEDSVKVSQASYAGTRLFEVEVDKEDPDHYEASELQKHDNMSLIGALSWMASQSRPDLQVGVSMSQQRQKQPTIGDVRFTNSIAHKALQFKDQGLVFYPVNLEAAVLLCYHDAGWANVPQDQGDPFYRLNDDENQKGLIDVPGTSWREAKAKKANSTIASQLGGLYVFTNQEVLEGVPCRGSIVDWRSGACDRVCRSTFAAETMACCTATETGDFIVKFMETILTGKLARGGTRFKVRFLSDCRSLYDHLVRDGVPRVPTCKRLAIDLAGIREDLRTLGRIVWIPTGAQLADILTKPLRPESWWRTVRSEIKLTFREDGRKNCIEEREPEPV